MRHRTCGFGGRTSTSVDRSRGGWATTVWGATAVAEPAIIIGRDFFPTAAGATPALSSELSASECGTGAAVVAVATSDWTVTVYDCARGCATSNRSPPPGVCVEGFGGTGFVNFCSSV